LGLDHERRARLDGLLSGTSSGRSALASLPAEAGVHAVRAAHDAAASGTAWARARRIESVLATEESLDQIRTAPADEGTLELIARRPVTNEREVLEEGELDVEVGLVGDCWSVRGKNPNPKAQLTLMSARAAEMIAGERERWHLAGDQLYVDLDLSADNLPPGTRLAIGSAVIEVTDAPHLGCEKFTARFGAEARELVNSPEGLALNLRGINTRVVEGGTVRRGASVRKLG
jgi:MOSC domain-containing protein YiiM